MVETRETAALDSQLNGLFRVAELYDRHPSLDQDKDGKIRRTEVYAALPSNEYKGDDAAALATFRLHFKDIGKFKNEGEKRDVTIEDLKEMAKLSRLKAMKMIAEGAPLFRTLDRNGDGKLTKEELKKQIDESKANTPTKRAVEAMLADFELIGGKNAGFITRDQIKEYVAKRLTNSQEKSLDSIARTFQQRKERLDGASSRTFSERVPFWSVKGEAIKQGEVGDCWLISACSSFFEKNPWVIEKFFKEDGDKVTVTFPYEMDGKKLHATVDKPSEAERALYATTGKYGIYGAIAEKALGEIFKQHPELKGKLTGVEQRRGKGAPVQEYLEGSRTPFAIELLMGEKARTVDLSKLSKEQIDAMLRLSWNAVTTCDSDGNWPKVGNNEDARAAKDRVKEDKAKDKEGSSALDSKDVDAIKRSGGVLRDIQQADRTNDRTHDQIPDLEPKPWDVNEDDIGGEEPSHSAHEFAILHYDEKNKIVTVRNPWGHGELVDEALRPLDGKDDGVMKLTLDQFVKYFRHMSLPERVVKQVLRERS